MTTRTHETEITADPKVPLVRIVREFDAAPEKVFRAHTDPDLFAQWNGPDGVEMQYDYFDCRTGGSYRYTITSDGNEFGFHGSFHDVIPSEVIVQTFTFEGVPDGVALERLVFEDLGERPHPPDRDLARRQLRGPRRVPRQRHGEGCRRGLRPPRSAARRLSSGAEVLGHPRDRELDEVGRVDELARGAADHAGRRVAGSRGTRAGSPRSSPRPAGRRSPRCRRGTRRRGPPVHDDRSRGGGGGRVASTAPAPGTPRSGSP